MSNPTMPALFTVLVGDDPERRVMLRTHGDGAWDGVIYPEGIQFHNDAHDVVEVIPAGTPVDRIAVLPEVGEPMSAPQPGNRTLGEVASDAYCYPVGDPTMAERFDLAAAAVVAAVDARNLLAATEEEKP